MKKSNGKVLTFMKRNAVYLVLAFCVLAVGLSITLMLLSGNSSDITAELPTGDNPSVIAPVPDEQESSPVIKPDTSTDTGNDSVEPVEKPVSFIMPVKNVISVNDYSDTMVWNATMKYYTSHKAMDIFAEEGSSVFAVYDGTVLNVETSIIEGTTVTIDHGNGLKSVYNSLSDSIDVVVGQTVNTGDVIGEVSVTNRKEDNLGSHLHFYMIENGTTINPEKYLTFENK
jgi:murein DD-endopeptidase MepM/ murein hydrolase activator NlpD